MYFTKVYQPLQALILLTSLLYFQNPIQAMEEANVSLDTKHGIKRVSETLYTGHHKTGVRFAMERLTGEGPRLDFWKSWVRCEYGDYLGSDGYHSEYKRKWADSCLPQNAGFPQFLARDHTLSTGLYSFQRVLSNISLINELWVAFACQNEIHSVTDIAADQIEMAVTVSTDKDAPMVTHMGISRSFQYLLKACETIEKRKTLASEGVDQFIKWYGHSIPRETDYVIHKNLSNLLHSFGSLVMLSEHIEKLYMITTPVDVMRNIMLKAFPGIAFEGDNLQKATQEYLKAIHEDKMTHKLASSQTRGRVKKLYEERDELKYQAQCLNEQNDSEKKGVEQKALASAFEMERLNIALKEIKVTINALLKEEEIQKAMEIQSISEAMPFDMTTSPIRRMNYPQYVTQIWNKDRTRVVYEHNETLRRVTIGELVFTGEEVNRFRWFNGGDMGFRDSYPYVTISLKDLSLCFDK